MYENLTPRWAIFLMGCIAAVLASVPFVAYWKGPQIRARSRYSKLLIEEERRRVAAVHRGGEEAGGEEVEIGQGDANEEGRGEGKEEVIAEGGEEGQSKYLGVGKQGLNV
jgi:hypothetical protein